MPCVARARDVAALGVLVALSGCGSSLRDNDDARADVDATTHSSCASTVLQALGAVAKRVYGEGISSERTVSALRMITSSPALRTAVEAGNAHDARAAARALLATGHMTNLRVTVGGRVLVDVGGAAVAPLSGTLVNTAGKPMATFQTSVWADGGLIAEVNGIAEGQTVLRTAPRPPTAGRDLAGAIALPSNELLHGLQGRTVSRARGGRHQFTSRCRIAEATRRGWDRCASICCARSPRQQPALCPTRQRRATTFLAISRIARLI